MSDDGRHHVSSMLMRESLLDKGLQASTETPVVRMLPHCHVVKIGAGSIIDKGREVTYPLVEAIGEILADLVLRVNPPLEQRGRANPPLIQCVEANRIRTRCAQASVLLIPRCLLGDFIGKSLVHVGREILAREEAPRRVDERLMVVVEVHSGLVTVVCVLRQCLEDDLFELLRDTPVVRRGRHNLHLAHLL